MTGLRWLTFCDYCVINHEYHHPLGQEGIRSLYGAFWANLLQYLSASAEAVLRYK